MYYVKKNVEMFVPSCGFYNKNKQQKQQYVYK